LLVFLLRHGVVINQTLVTWRHPIAVSLYACCSSRLTSLDYAILTLVRLWGGSGRPRASFLAFLSVFG